MVTVGSQSIKTAIDGNIPNIMSFETTQVGMDKRKSTKNNNEVGFGVRSMSIFMVVVILISIFSAPVSASDNNSTDVQSNHNQTPSVPSQITTQSNFEDISWSKSETIKIYDIDYDKTVTREKNVDEDVIDTGNYDTGDGGWERIRSANPQGGHYYPEYIDSIRREYEFTVPESSGVDLDRYTGPHKDFDDAVELRAGLWNTGTETFVPDGDGFSTNSLHWEYGNPVDGQGKLSTLVMSVEEINRFDRALVLDARVLGDDDPGLLGDNDNDDATVQYTETTYIEGWNTEETYSFTISDKKIQSTTGDATMYFNFVGVASQRGAGDGKQLSISINGNEIFSGFDYYAGGQRTVQFPASYLTEGENEVTISAPDISGGGAYGFTISDLGINAQTNSDFDSDGVKNWNDNKPNIPEDNDGYQDNDGDPENPAPSVSIDDTQVGEGSSTTVTADATDPEGESLSYDWSVSGDGTISGSGSSVTYNAPSDISSGTSGTVTVTVSEQDEGKPAQASGTVTVQNDVSNDDPDRDGIANSGDQCDNKAEDADGYQDGDGCPENPAPSVSLSDTQVSEGGTVTVQADGTDPEGESLSYDWSAGGDGTISGSGPSVTYDAPDQISSSISETITVTVSEQDADKSAQTSATVTIQNDASTDDPDSDGIQNSKDQCNNNAEDSDGYQDSDGCPENPAPSVSIDNKRVSEGGSITLTADATDPEGEILTYEWSVSGTGSISGSGSSVTYDAPSGISSDTSETVSVTAFEKDTSKSARDSALITVEDTGNTNRGPKANDISISTKEGQAVSDSFDASDPDGDSLSYAIVNDPSNGSVSTNGESFTYTPDTDYSGSDSFTYRVDDGNGGSDTATASITVRDTEDTTPPIADAGSDKTVTVDSSVNFDGSGSSDNTGITAYEWDVDNDGSYEKMGASISHTFQSTGPKTVTLQVSDAAGNTDTDSVSMNVTTDDDPVAAVTAEDVSAQNGTEATVQFELENTGQDVHGYILDLGLPEGWLVVDHTEDTGTWKSSENTWLWQSIPSTSKVQPTVTVAVPDEAQGTYNISADVLTDDSVVAETNATVTVTDTRSISAAIDENNDNRIGDFEILQAIDYWRTGTAVPNTERKVIGDFEILGLIEKWRDNSKI